jgi:hypothetical protein
VEIEARLLGSGVLLETAGTTVVCDEILFTVVVPSRFTSTVKANPSVVLVVRVGTVGEGRRKGNLPEPRSWRSPQSRC